MNPPLNRSDDAAALASNVAAPLVISRAPALVTGALHDTFPVVTFVEPLTSYVPEIKLRPPLKVTLPAPVVMDEAVST
jgi:hypothetical protein